MARRIALFGGTFDPIHNAHLTVARESARQFRLSRVLFVPASQPLLNIIDTDVPSSGK